MYLTYPLTLTPFGYLLVRGWRFRPSDTIYPRQERAG